MAQPLAGLFPEISLSMFSEIAKASLLLGMGWLGSYLISQFCNGVLKHHVSKHHQFLLSRILSSGFFILFLVSALQEVGFNLNVLLGTAGVLTLAMGFAAQTSASNLISGLFLVFERPFELGDTISLNNITGDVQSIDLLSVKLATPDMQYVRIPNETVLRSAVINLSKMPYRRMDIDLVFALNINWQKLLSLFDTVAAENALCLSDPKPQVNISGFDKGHVHVQWLVFAAQKEFTHFKFSIQRDLLTELMKQGFELASPHMTVDVVQN